MQDQEYRGLLSKWKKYRYKGLKFLSLKEEQKSLAKELFDGDFEYYDELKDLASTNQAFFYANLKQELKTRKGWHAVSLFLQLIEEENDLEEILELSRITRVI